MATFLFDNDISPKIVGALRALVHGHEVIALREKFEVSAKDADWIPEAGKNGWIVISRDYNQRRRDAEHRALRVHQVKAIYIRQSTKATDLFSDAARIIKQWPKMEAWGLGAEPGTLAQLDSRDQIVKLS